MTPQENYQIDLHTCLDQGHCVHCLLRIKLHLDISMLHEIGCILMLNKTQCTALSANLASVYSNHVQGEAVLIRKTKTNSPPIPPLIYP